MTKLIFSIITFTIFIISINISYSGESGAFAVHPRAGITLNFHSPDFRSFNGSSDCGLFEKGFGIGPPFGLGLEYNLSDKHTLGLGISYMDKSGTLTLEGSYPIRDTVTGNIYSIVTENSLKADLKYIQFDFSYFYNLTDKFINGPLRLNSGLTIDFPITSTFEQKESILSPPSAVFTINGNRTRERDIVSGNIATITKMNFGFYIGIENFLKSGQTNFFTQSISIQYYFNNVSTDVNWKVWQLKFMLGYIFGSSSSINLPVPEPPMPEPIKIKEKSNDTIPLVDVVNIPVLNPTIDIKVKDINGTIYTGYELLATIPIVNAVFFERESSVIPEFYIMDKQELPDFFSGDAVEKHKWIMPRIADILIKNPGSGLFLEGTTADEFEPEGTKLSTVRVQKVKEIFLKLGIPEKIIKTNARILPKYPSNQDYMNGSIENQRVDLFVTNAPLQDYVSLQKFEEFRGSADISANFKELEDDKPLKLTTDIISTPMDGRKGKYLIDFTKRITSSDTIISTSANLQYENLSTSDEMSKNKCRFPVKLVDFDISKFNAILRFDYNSSILSDDNKALLRKLVSVLPEGIVIIVAGSADALGTEERNAVLTRERAGITVSYLNEICKGKFEIEKITEFNKFPEDSQQGRFLNRAIRIKLRK